MNQFNRIKNKTNGVKKDKIWLIFSFAFFAFMMVFHLTHSALWGDELVEYYYSQKAIRTGQLYKAIISTYQPPLYNFLMHFWLKINGSLFWFRFFNVLLGIVSFIFLYITLRSLIGCRKACATSFLLAVCYRWIYCIQECSEYTLMLCGLFMALCFYVKCLECFSYTKMIGFVLSCVMAIYSQYGGAFVVAPLLGIFFAGMLFDKKQSLPRKIAVVGVYLFSFFAFALPLYVLFAKIQVEGHKISENSVHFTPDLLKDIPFIFGRIFAWLFSMNGEDNTSIVFGILGLIFFGILINILIQKKENWIKRSLLLCMLITYALHYVLVRLHLYAMVHADQSEGFYTRYSYFYIPLLAVVVPITYDEIKVFFSKNRIVRLACALLMGTVLLVSFVSILQNWHKSYTDQVGEIWLDHKGWEDVTYLYGGASRWAIKFYAGRSSRCPENYLDKVEEAVDNDNLPDKFWAWANDWNIDGWQVTIDKAEELGYAVNIYVDYGTKGKLAYCHRND